jgi:hypothetical protein
MPEPERAYQDPALPPGSPAPADFWGSKPGWCQPWSILLTGGAAIGGSWALLHRWWITLPVALLVLAWWGLFLVVVPRTAARTDP